MKRRIKSLAQRLYENKEDESQAVGCVMFTDVVGSSKLWNNYGDNMKKALFEHNNRISNIVGDDKAVDKANKSTVQLQKKEGAVKEGLYRPCYYPLFEKSQGHGGMVVKTIGDAFMVAFEQGQLKNPLYEAIAAGIDIQESLVKEPIFLDETKKDRIQLRIGIAYGPMNKSKLNIQNHLVSDYHGNTVNTASRMESKVSEPDGVAFCYLAGNNIRPEEVKEIRKLITKYQLKIIDFLKEEDIEEEAKKPRQDWLGLFQDSIKSAMKPGQFDNQKLSGSRFAKEIATHVKSSIAKADDEKFKEIDANDLPEPIALGDPDPKRRSGRLIPNIKTVDKSTDELNGVGPLTAYSIIIK